MKRSTFALLHNAVLHMLATTHPKETLNFFVPALLNSPPSHSTNPSAASFFEPPPPPANNLITPLNISSLGGGASGG